MNDTEDKVEHEFKWGTKEEADRMFKESIDCRKNIYCPLKDGTCEADCECFRMPKIINQRSDDNPFWDCTGGFCTAYMLVGPT